MRYKKTLFGTLLCIIFSLLLYGYFESPDKAYGKNQDSIEINSTKDEYQVKRLDEPDITGELEIHYLDVGQGDCTLLICDGQTMLIDTGLDEQGTKIQNYLQKRGINRLDYLVLTHPDIDHIGSADVIMTKFDIGTIFMTEYDKETKTYKKLMKLIEDRQIHYLSPAVANVYSLGEATFQILSPIRDYEESNNASIVLLLTHGDNSFLFTGDAEKEAEADMLESGLNLAADVYHAGHHGSKTASSEAFLDAVMPKYAIISCGENNQYGLPDAQVLNSLREREVKVFRTDEQGTIIASSDGKKITFNMAPSESWKAGE